MRILRTALRTAVSLLAVAVFAAFSGVPFAQFGRANALALQPDTSLPLDELPAYALGLTSASFADNQPNRALAVPIEGLADLGGVGKGVGSFTLVKVKHSATFEGYLPADIKTRGDPPVDATWTGIEFPVAFSHSARPPNVAKTVIDGT